MRVPRATLRRPTVHRRKIVPALYEGESSAVRVAQTSLCLLACCASEVAVAAALWKDTVLR